MQRTFSSGVALFRDVTAVSRPSVYKRLAANRVMHAEFGERFMLSSNSDRPSIRALGGVVRLDACRFATLHR
jgi:hypothetical protein